MAQLRTALRAYAVEGHDPPGDVVERVNGLMWELGPPTMTTLAYAVVDPLAETLEASSPATRRRCSPPTASRST